MDEGTKEQLGTLITQARQRELAAAITEQREPHLCYLALDVEKVRTHITGLLQLDEEINQKEHSSLFQPQHLVSAQTAKRFFVHNHLNIQITRLDGLPTCDRIENEGRKVAFMPFKTLNSLRLVQSRRSSGLTALCSG